MRGYNRSNKPKSVENYDMKLLVGDIVVLIHHCKQDKTILVGHDWEVGWWCDSLQ
jgi:pimeloyl-ACP methyl ester carboxylesterase